MSKIINSLSGLNLTVPINGGSCSKIYKISPDEYFKLLNEDYRDLAEPENIEVLETLLELQKVKTPSLATPITIYCNKDSLFGYTSKIMHGISLEKLPANTKLSLLRNALKGIKPEIKELAKQGIKTEDIGGDNIMLSDHMSIIDLELSLVAKGASSDYLYTRTMNQILNSTIYSSIGPKAKNNIQTAQIIYLREGLESGKNDDFEQLFDLMINELENAANQEIKTIGESKKAYQKVK